VPGLEARVQNGGFLGRPPTWGVRPEKENFLRVDPWQVFGVDFHARCFFMIANVE
jgi:hypothetical protein